MRSVTKSGKEVRIFHIEDDPFDIELVRIHLEAVPRPVTLIAISEDAQWHQALRSQCPDIIISDSTVPGFSTERVLLFAKDSSPSIPVIVYSGTVDPEKREEAMAAGALAFIDKSNAADLISWIGRILDSPEEKVPPADLPVLAQCANFRCLAVRTRDGTWVDFNRRQPLPAVLSWQMV